MILSSSKNSRELLCRYGSNLNADSKYGIQSSEAPACDRRWKSQPLCEKRLV